MKKAKLLLTSLMLLIALSSGLSMAFASDDGSNADWPMFRQNLNHSGYTTTNSTANSAQLLWKFPTSASVWSSPAIAEGLVVFGCKNCYTYCLNASTGEYVWSLQTLHEVNSSPAIYNGNVYVGSYDGWVYCINLSSGVPVWGANVGGKVLSSPAVIDDRVFIGSGAHDIFCFNASTGATLWTYPTTARVDSSPAVVDGIVYVACDDYHLYAINATTGEIIWREYTSSNLNSPCIDNGYTYIGAYDGWIACVNASNGVRSWTFQTQDTVSSSAATAYGRVYVGSDDGGIYCLNATDGTKLWQTQTGYWVWSSPTIANGNLFVGSQDYTLYCLDAYTGQKKWSYQADGIIDSSPSIVGDTLYFGSHDHHLYAFRLSDSTAEPIEASTPIFWSTIIFNTLFCIAWGLVIFIIIRYFVASTRNKRVTQQVAGNSTIESWLTAHINLACAAMILAFSAIYLLNLNNPPLWATDEKTYTQIAYHIFKSGDYFTPWVTGEPAFWVGKPPLLMWLTSVSYQVLGVSNFAARVWMPLFGALSLVMVFFLGKKLFNPKVGFISVFVLGTFVTFYQYATHMMTDVPMVFFMLASIYFLLLSEDKTKDTLKYAVFSGVFFGLALMTKQLEALLIPAIMLVYLLFTSRGRFVFAKQFTLHWGVAAAIFAPYVLYMMSVSKDFWDCFFIYSNVSRLISPLEGHNEGYLYYFQNLLTNETFWAILLPFAVVFAIYNIAAKRSRADILLVGWIVIVLGLFTLAQTKLFWYILPAMPAFALAIGNLLYQLAHYVRLKSKNLFDYLLSNHHSAQEIALCQENNRLIA